MYYIYFLASGKGSNNPVKVGYTSNIDSRMKTLQVASPFKLKLNALVKVETLEEARYLEKKLHKALARMWSHGEWYYINNVNLKKIMATNNINVEFEKDFNIKDTSFLSERRLRSRIKRLQERNECLKQEKYELEEYIKIQDSQIESYYTSYY